MLSAGLFSKSKHSDSTPGSDAKTHLSLQKWTEISAIPSKDIIRTESEKKSSDYVHIKTYIEKINLHLKNLSKCHYSFTIQFAFKNLVSEFAEFEGDAVKIKLNVISPLSYRLAEHIHLRLETLFTKTQAPEVLFKLLQKDDYKKMFAHALKDLKEQMALYHKNLSAEQASPANHI